MTYLCAKKYYELHKNLWPLAFLYFLSLIWPVPVLRKPCPNYSTPLTMLKREYKLKTDILRMEKEYRRKATLFCYR